MNSAIPLIWLLAVTWFIVPVAAQERSVSPGINNHYHGARHADWVSVFESPSREVYAQRYAIADALRIKPGMRVADICAGTGFFSLLFAQRAGPGGIVYAVDIAENFVKTIEDKAEAAGLGNLVGIINNGRDTGLPPDSIDLAFISNTYHHFEYPRDTMHSIHQALSDQGEVVIIDFHKDPHTSSRWVQNHVRSNREQVIREMWHFGFDLAADLPLLRANYFLKFIKRSGS